jgi:hypothetical protein
MTVSPLLQMAIYVATSLAAGLPLGVAKGAMLRRAERRHRQHVARLMRARTLPTVNSVAEQTGQGRRQLSAVGVGGIRGWRDHPRRGQAVAPAVGALPPRALPMPSDGSQVNRRSSLSVCLRCLDCRRGMGSALPASPRRRQSFKTAPGSPPSIWSRFGYGGTVTGTPSVWTSLTGPPQSSWRG